MAKKLPKRFAKYFWDIDPQKIDIQKYPQYVLERLLQFGDLAAVKWGLNQFGKDKLIEVVKTSRQINRKTANFFINIYNLKPEEVLCFNREYQSQHRAVWPY